MSELIGSDNATNAALGIAILTFLTVVFNSFMSWIVQARDRRWKREDAQFQEMLVRSHEQTQEQLKENTALTNVAIAGATAAYTEANDVNKKLEDTARLTRAAMEKLVPRSPEMRTRASDKPVDPGWSR